MAGITPPISFKSHIHALLDADDNSIESLVEGLKGALVSLNASALALQLVDEVEGLDDMSLIRIVSFLVSSAKVMSDVDKSPAEFSEELAMGIVNEADFAIGIDKEDRLRKRLEILFSGDTPLKVTAKVQGVIEEHDHVFCKCRIMTDIRPIFSDQVGEPPQNAVLVHSLKIGYHENKEHKEFYVTLDDEDIGVLKEALERAVEKSNSLEIVANNSGLNLLKWS